MKLFSWRRRALAAVAFLYLLTSATQGMGQIYLSSDDTDDHIFQRTTERDMDSLEEQFFYILPENPRSKEIVKELVAKVLKEFPTRRLDAVRFQQLAVLPVKEFAAFRDSDGKPKVRHDWKSVILVGIRQSKNEPVIDIEAFMKKDEQITTEDTLIEWLDQNDLRLLALQNTKNPLSTLTPIGRAPKGSSSAAKEAERAMLFADKAYELLFKEYGAWVVSTGEIPVHRFEKVEGSEIQVGSEKPLFSVPLFSVAGFPTDYHYRKVLGVANAAPRAWGGSLLRLGKDTVILPGGSE
ncbi:MAG: hypothetical protein KDD51_02555 [Bdellovibrionales bacterium]|nr:hypothetical protein [Bdellovibrionales bacterium]